MPADLDTGLLLKIMKRLGDDRDSEHSMESRKLFDLIPELVERDGRENACKHLQRHLKFLTQCGLIYPKAIISGFCLELLSLTLKGTLFVQPELAGFESQSMWPEVIKTIEDKVQVLTYPQEEKDGMLYRLRDAVSKQAPDVIAKVIAEVASKAFLGK